MPKNALTRYRKKRDFDVTSEPAGKDRPEERARQTGTYVIQRHAATRLHFDFRLELDGVLKSWAVPKGPSLIPGEKRLAVEVEDHPLEYGTFEGSIPRGEYGAGHVLLWDHGTWTPKGDPHQGLKKGKLSFTLDGERLHGGFALVRLRGDAKKPQWLLLKESDAHAKKKGSREVTAPEPMPPLKEFHPQLATLDGQVPKGKEWIFEPKLDGYRGLAAKDGDEVTILSRSGQDWTKKLPGIRDALSKLHVAAAVFDGEICAIDEQGRPSFQGLQGALHRGPPRGIQVVYFIFDLLFLDGFDLREHPLEKRKAILESVLRGQKSPIGYVTHVTGAQGEELFAAACRGAFEGIVAKRKDAPHRPIRTRDWLKVKCQQRQELVVVGFTAPRGSRKGLGALVLGVSEAPGRLRYAGQVGTGFSQATLASLSRRLTPTAIDEPAVRGAPRLRNVTWVEPKLVAEVTFTEWTKDGVLRHPSFVGLRDDKPVNDVRRERAEDNVVQGVRISHPERVIDRASGVTKIDLARYHEAVADVSLPYLVHRPLALLRCPDGADAACFFQKQRTPGMPHSIHTVKVGKNPVIYVEAAPGLISLVQFGAVELHAWGARLPGADRPDFIVMDLDPDTELPFGRVVDAAMAMREVLRELGLESFAKTTGGKGLHVVVPIAPRYPYEEVKDFSHGIALEFARAEPKRYTAVMSKRARQGKIFVDYLRNGPGATAIAPYSPRAREGAPVAMPVAWRDLPHLDPREFDVRSVPGLLRKRRKDPWADVDGLRQRLPRTAVTKKSA